MATKGEKRYAKSPKVKAKGDPDGSMGEDGAPAKAAREGDGKKAEVDKGHGAAPQAGAMNGADGTEVHERHAGEREAMTGRHNTERTQMNRRHEKEFADMTKMHQEQVSKMVPE